MKYFFLVIRNWRAIIELLRDVSHGLCAISDPHHIHADQHERDIRKRAGDILTN